MRRQRPAPGKWQYAATIYAYLPSIGGTMSFPAGSGSSGLNVDASKLLDSLDMAFMGSFEAHNGRWGMFADVLYLDVGGSGSATRDFSIGTVWASGDHHRGSEPRPQGHDLDACR